MAERDASVRPPPYFRDDGGGAYGYCPTCQAELRWVLPMDVGVWVAMVRAFVRRHRHPAGPQETLDA